MTTGLPSPSAGLAAVTRLNGWKEIASYFGRGVRTVQRWEKAFGMPVHRIGTGRGENVHAFAHELDAWLATVTRSRTVLDQPGDNDTVATGPVAPAPPAPTAEPVASPVAVPAAAARPVRAAWALAAIVLLLLLAAFAAWRYWPAGVPSTARPDGDTLRVYDADNRLLWSHTFSGRLPADPPFPFLGNGLRFLIDDVNGDGRREVLTFGPDDDPSWTTKLFCFDAGGRLLWTRAVNRTVRFGETNFAPSWTGYRLFTTGTGREKSLWSTWIHTESGLFPCLLERLSGVTGMPESEFWSAGYVNVVKEFRFAGRRAVFVGTNDNDHKGAGLMVLEASRPTGAAAAETEDKTCRNCPAGRPLAQLVFPRMDIADLGQFIPTIFDLRRADSGEFSAWVAHPAPDPGAYGSVLYQLGANLEPIRAEVNASYHSVHKAAEDAGRLKHPFGEQDLAQVWPVLAYDGSRFVPITGNTAR